MLNAAGMLLVMLLLAALADPSAAWAQLPCHRPSLRGAPHPAVAERGRRLDGRLGPVALSSRGIDAQTGTTQVQESERDAAFLQWASQRGVVAPKLAIAEFPPGYRGMAATGPIPPGATPQRAVPLSRAIRVSCHSKARSRALCRGCGRERYPQDPQGHSHCVCSGHG